jgi:hypothetical protein
LRRQFSLPLLQIKIPRLKYLSFLSRLRSRSLMPTTFHAVDSVPFLGAIPLIGRLFRSEYEVEEEVNLIITVSAKTVED